MKLQLYHCCAETVALAVSWSLKKQHRFEQEHPSAAGHIKCSSKKNEKGKKRAKKHQFVFLKSVFMTTVR